MDGPLDRRLFDRRLYLAAAILFPLIVLVGFGRTYYLKGLFDTPPLPSGLVHLHGLVMTAWVVLFVVQVRFIPRSKFFDISNWATLGSASAHSSSRPDCPRRSRSQVRVGLTPPNVPPLEFMLVPLFDLLIFALLFGAAILYRRRPAAHKRLMLLTAVNFLPPALARIPIASLQSLGPLWFFGFPTVLVLLCLGLDARRNHHLNPVFAAGAALLIGSYVARLALMTTGPWLTLAAWLTSFV